AGPAHVAEQQLDDRRGPDELHADGVLGPAHRVHDCGGAGAAGRGGPGLGDVEELLPRDAADLLDDLRRVAGEVPLEDLVDAARVLQRLLPGGAALRQWRGAALARA